MKRNGYLSVAAVLGLIFGSGVAAALILDAGTTKSAAGWRSDLVKQINAYNDCMNKAMNSCDSKGDEPGVLECIAECDTSDPDGEPGNTTCFTGGTVPSSGPADGTPCVSDSFCDYQITVPPGIVFDRPGRCLADPRPCATYGTEAANSFAAAIDKCNSKFNPAKKGFDYDGSGAAVTLGDVPALGCLADCSTADGTQLDLATCSGGDPNADISGVWQAAYTAEDGTVRRTLSLFDFQFATIYDFGGLGPGGCIDENPDDPQKCVSSDSKVLGKMQSCINKALLKCENDFKGGAGNGGTTDDGTACDNATVAACVSDASAALQSAGSALIVTSIQDGLLGASDQNFNRQIDYDSGGSPAVSGDAAPSCGTCGDGTIDFGEECDPGAALPPGCASCPSTSNFLSGQNPCECF